MMQKLTKQQIVLLSAMVLAILYGAYNFLFSTSGNKPVVDAGKRSLELRIFVDDVTANMTQEKSSQFYAYLADKAETDWRNDPFYDRKSYKLWLMSKDKSKMTEDIRQSGGFIYTGYLEVDNKKMAVINGVEYGVGESLEVEGYALGKIYPSKVVIINKEDRTKIEVPLQD